jgi:4-amino-4-deoxy-L-arabinose transferase-like glycosyltransferase
MWVLVLALGLRLPALGRPLLGNFATKSVVYAMIARNWVEGRADWRYPTVDCLIGGHRSLHMLELPVAAYLTGWLWSLGGGSLDVWGRAVAIAMSVSAVGLIYLLVRRRHSPDAALGAGTLLAISPIGVIYGQSFMLEPSLLLLTLVTVYGCDRWLEGGRAVWLGVVALALALVLLTKIYMVVLLLPLAVWVLGPRSLSGRSWPDQVAWRKQMATVAALGLAMLPAAFWYWHAASTAAPGSPLADRVFYSERQSAAVHWPPHELLKSSDFYRQVLDDMAGVVLTPVGLMLVLAGFLHPAWRRYLPWLLAMAILVGLLPRKFYEMNYYWMAVLPPLCILAGLGWEQLRRRLVPGRTMVAVLLLVGLLFSLRYSARPAFVTPVEDRAVVAAGRAVQDLTGADEPVVAMHGTGIDLVYYCNRPGWAIAPETPDLAAVLKDCHRQGARYLVFVGRSAGLPAALSGYRCCVAAEGYAVYDLGHPSDVFISLPSFRPAVWRPLRVPVARGDGPGPQGFREARVRHPSRGGGSRLRLVRTIRFSG